MPKANSQVRQVPSTVFFRSYGDWLDYVGRGGEAIITRNGRPIVRITQVKPEPPMQEEKPSENDIQQVPSTKFFSSYGDWLDYVARGGEVVITRNGRPIVRMTQVKPEPPTINEEE